MTRILSKAEKRQREKKLALEHTVYLAQKFCQVDIKLKRISITHPVYDKLKKAERDILHDLKFNHGFYIQWEFYNL